MEPFSRFAGETPILPPSEAKFVLEGLTGVFCVYEAKGAALSP